MFSPLINFFYFLANYLHCWWFHFIYVFTTYKFCWFLYRWCFHHWWCFYSSVLSKNAKVQSILLLKKQLTLKRLEGWRERGWGVNLTPPLWFFEKSILWWEGKTLVFLTVNIIIGHIFTENFIEVPQVVQKIWSISLSILTIFIDFHQFFVFFAISLWQRN